MDGIVMASLVEPNQVEKLQLAPVIRPVHEELASERGVLPMEHVASEIEFGQPEVLVESAADSPGELQPGMAAAQETGRHSQEDPEAIVEPVGHPIEELVSAGRCAANKPRSIWKKWLGPIRRNEPYERLAHSLERSRFLRWIHEKRNAEKTAAVVEDLSETRDEHDLLEFLGERPPEELYVISPEARPIVPGVEVLMARLNAQVESEEAIAEPKSKHARRRDKFFSKLKKPKALQTIGTLSCFAWPGEP
ncbi:hypothetical protein AMS68_005177 [Peltaster fructicola]|uniref:Uncharacterized protein n=1 Tax=Peltaster fructicola TaxID=286661 RepID=A0A6H0XZ15_9PEZI|nr:hypothetical protein AMS68_005177 [Peltaster fructicola]